MRLLRQRICRIECAKKTANIVLSTVGIKLIMNRQKLKKNVFVSVAGKHISALKRGSLIIVALVVAALQKNIKANLARRYIKTRQSLN